MSAGAGPLRICFIGWADHVHLERWAGWFARAGHKVDVLSVSGFGSYPRGVGQHLLNPNGRGEWFARLRLRWLLARLRPQVVHVHWAHFATGVAAVWKGPFVVTAWGSDIYRRDKFSDSEWRALGVALRRADSVTCDSDDLAAQLRVEFGLPAERVSVVQWGVDTQTFFPAAASQDFLDELGLDGKRVVFSARNFTPLYNQETVVRAFAKLLESRSDVVLLMKRYGGDPAYHDAIRALISDLGITSSVRICDSVPYERMPEFYRAASVTVSVPFSDATPMALLEAMACGSIPVVSDLPSLREWIRDGENGRIVPVDDVGALADAMVDALSNEALRLRASASNLGFVTSTASQDAHMNRMTDMLRGVVG